MRETLWAAVTVLARGALTAGDGTAAPGTPSA